MNQQGCSRFQYCSAIPFNVEYVPTVAPIIPTAVIVVLKTICALVAFLPTIFIKHSDGIIIATIELRTDPIKDIIRPKNGKTNAAATVEKTSAALRRMKHHKLFETGSGSSSSIPLAKGIINNAYFVNGLITVVHNAILETKERGGIFKVI